MGFSIGRFLGKIAGPVIGGLLGGPAGAVFGAGISAGFARPAPSPQPIGIPQFLGSAIGPTARGFGTTGFGVTRRRTGLGLAPIIGAAIVATVAELLAISREQTGQPVTRQKVVDAVKHCGIELAASMFGLSETEICQIVVSRGRRRGRGISAADMRRTRSTIRKVHNITHDLQRLKPTVRRHHK